MRNFFTKLFVKSPFGPLREHLDRVSSCVSLLRPMFEALSSEDYESIAKLAKNIAKFEHEADQIKNGIRMHMPRHILMPVDRMDFLMLLREQDAIADAVEDISVLITVRVTKIPNGIKEDLFELIDRIVNTFEHCHQVIDEINNLIEASFGGPEAERIPKMVEEVGTQEWKADQEQFTLAKKIFELEGSESPISIMQWSKIVEKIGQVANHSENVADRFLAMMPK